MSAVLFINCVSAANYSLTTRGNDSIIDTLSQTLVEWVGKLLQYFFDILDLKMRSVKFVSSLYTDDNLVLLKRFLNVGLRFGRWVHEIIPNTTEEGLSRLWSSIFPTSKSQSNSDFIYDPIEPTGFESDADSRSLDNENFVNNIASQAMSLHSLINARRS